jgi:hypothetical protein
MEFRFLDCFGMLKPETKTFFNEMSDPEDPIINYQKGV